MISILDVETLRWHHEVAGGWDNIKGFGLAMAVVGVPSPMLCGGEDLSCSVYVPYGDTAEVDGMGSAGLALESADFEHIAEILNESERIISFNGNSFDFLVMESAGFNANLWQGKSFDILARFIEAAGHRISLNDLAKGLLGEEKSLSGEKAVDFFRAACHLLRNAERQPQDLFDKDVSILDVSGPLVRTATHLLETVRDYCKRDVLLTYGIYRKILELNGEIRYYNKVTRGRPKTRIRLDETTRVFMPSSSPLADV